MKTKRKFSMAGRPPKFREERKPVTMTLPTRVLEILRAVDPDRARAIAKLATAADFRSTGRKSVEIVEVAPHRSLIVVAKNRSLEGIKGLHLVEIAPARYLITVQKNLSVESLEVQLRDKSEDAGEKSEDREFLSELLTVIRHQRRGKTVSQEELLIINL